MTDEKDEVREGEKEEEASAAEPSAEEVEEEETEEAPDAEPPDEEVEEEEEEAPPQQEAEEEKPASKVRKRAKTRLADLKKPKPRSWLSLGRLMVFISGGLLSVFFLIYLVEYSDLHSFSLLSLGILVLMLSPALPVFVVIRSGKAPGLLRINYAYAGFLWLLKLCGVSVMVGAAIYQGDSFFQGLDFWILLAAALVAAGTVKVELEEAADGEEGS